MLNGIRRVIYTSDAYLRPAYGFDEIVRHI